MLSVKQRDIKYHFLKVFGKTQFGIEPLFPGPLVNTLLRRILGILDDILLYSNIRLYTQDKFWKKAMEDSKLRY